MNRNWTQVSSISNLYYPILIFILLYYYLSPGLFEFAKNKTLVTGLAATPDGKKFAAISTDRKVRVFQFNTGKMLRVFDEALTTYTQMQQTPHALPNMEFGRR